MVVLEKARWSGGPQICPVANLPAFGSWGEAIRYLLRYSPEVHVALKWECKHCERWHFWTCGRGPSAISTVRRFNIPYNILVMYNESCSPKKRIAPRWTFKQINGWQ